jgi:hypothetical protein
MFRDNLSVPTSRVKNPRRVGPKDYSETSVRYYHYTLPNGAEQRSSHLLRDGNLKVLYVCEKYCSLLGCYTMCFGRHTKVAEESAVAIFRLSKKESSILKTWAAHYCANLVSIFQIVCSIVPHFKFVTVEHVTCIIVLKKLGWRNLKFWQWKLTAEKVTPFEFLMSNFRIYCPNFRNSNVLHNRTAIDSDLRNICGTKFSLRPCWSYGTPSW